MFKTKKGTLEGCQTTRNDHFSYRRIWFQVVKVSERGQAMILLVWNRPTSSHRTGDRPCRVRFQRATFLPKEPGCQLKAEPQTNSEKVGSNPVGTFKVQTTKLVIVLVTTCFQLVALVLSC